jgi:hypothetical protein
MNRVLIYLIGAVAIALFIVGGNVESYRGLIWAGVICAVLAVVMMLRRSQLKRRRSEDPGSVR